MICSSTRSWISSTDGAWLITLHLFSTLVAISRIWAAVSLSASRISLLPLVMAAMILVISKSTSQPLRLIIFIGGSLLLVLLSHVCKNALEQTTLFCSMPRCAVSMITRYCGLVKGLNRNSCHFRPSKNKQKYSAFFVYCYKSGTIFRISCAFHALFPVFRTAFPLTLS